MDAAMAVRTEDGCTVVEVAGDVDVYSTPQVREALLETINAGVRGLVIDLDAVEFIDSSGLGVLVVALKRVRSAESTLHLVCNREPILKMFRITGLMKVFPVHATLADAIAAVRASG